MQLKVIFILNQDNVFEGKFFHRVWIDPETFCVKPKVHDLIKYGRVTSPKLIILPVGDNKWLIQSEQSIKKRGILKNTESPKNKYISSDENKQIISLDINSSEKIDKKFFLQSSIELFELFFPADIDYTEAIDILINKLK